MLLCGAYTERGTRDNQEQLRNYRGDLAIIMAGTWREAGHFRRRFGIRIDNLVVNGMEAVRERRELVSDWNACVD